MRVEHAPRADGARVRVVFVAPPADDRPPKDVPDDESLGAAWVTLDELAGYALRGDEVRELFAHVASGAPLYPRSLVVDERAPYAR